MRRGIAYLAVLGVVLLSSCGKKESGEAPKAAAETPATATPAAPTGGAPHVSVHLKDGSKVPGTIVASSQADMVVSGDDGIERKIPLDKVASVEYGAAQPAQQASSAPAAPKESAAPPPEAARSAPQQTPPPAAPAQPPPPPVTTKTSVLSAGSEVSVRTNEAIDSKTAQEGQTFDAQVTRDARDANGDVVIPHGSKARILIKSASKGSRFHGASDLVLDLQSVSINGKRYRIETTDISQKGKDGVGANKRTAKFTGGGAAFGAIVGAIAGGGKGAAIGAGAGAGAGALTQILTKGGSIKVPAESVLTFSLDTALKVTTEE